MDEKAFVLDFGCANAIRSHLPDIGEENMEMADYAGRSAKSKACYTDDWGMPLSGTARPLCIDFIDEFEKVMGQF